jgi:hypothetical protein
VAGLWELGAVTVWDVWWIWVALAVLLAVAVLHRLFAYLYARELRTEVTWLLPKNWTLQWAADMRVLSEIARTMLKAFLFILTVSRLWAMGWPPTPSLQIEASLLGAAAIDGALLVLLTWTLFEARLLDQLEARQPVNTEGDACC